MTVRMPAIASDLGTGIGNTPAQTGVLGDPVGQVLIALVVIALVIVVGKFLLSLAWRLVTIAVVVVAVVFGLSAAGLL